MAKADGRATVEFAFDDGHGFLKGADSELAGPDETDQVGLGPYLSVLPAGRIENIRIAFTGTKHVEINSAKILSSNGNQIADIPLTQAKNLTGGIATKKQPLSLTASLLDEPMRFDLRLSSPLNVQTGNEPNLLEATTIFLLIAGLFWLADRKLAIRDQSKTVIIAKCIWDECRRHPILFLCGIALLATVANTFPLIFNHRSLVSPNLGFPLLYAKTPGLPGAPNEKLESINAADVGAMLWAHMPYSAVEGRAIRDDGEFPFWNRYNSCGTTLFGQGQSMMGDPLHLIVVYFRGAWQAWNFKYITAKFLYGLGIGLCLWLILQRLDLAALGAASSLWIGFFAYRYNHEAIYSVCYSPWILLPWLGMLRIQTFRQAAGWACLLIVADWMELSSGTAKESSMLILCLNGMGLFLNLSSNFPWHERIRRSAVLVIASGIFLLLSAPIWLTFIDSLRHSVTMYDEATAHQLQPGLLIALFDEIFAQDYSLAHRHQNPSLNFLFLSGLLFLLASIDSQRKSSTSHALAIACLIPSALVFGIIPPSWIDQIPIISGIGDITNTFACVLLVPLSILAMIGLSRCIDLPETTWRRSWKKSILFLALCLCLYLGFTQAVPKNNTIQFEIHPLRHSLFFVYDVSALVAAAILLPWGLRLTVRGNNRRLCGFVILTVSLVAILFRHGLFLQTKFDRYVMNPRKGHDLAAPSAAVEYMRKLSDSEPTRVEGFDGTLWPGYSAVYGLEGPSGPDALVNPYYYGLFQASKIPLIWGWCLINSPKTASLHQAFTDALNIRYFFKEREFHHSPIGSFKLSQDLDMEIYESPTAWPRAFFTDSVLMGDGAASYVAALNSGDGRPFAFADTGTELPSSAELSQRQIAPAHGYACTTNSTAFTISASGPGVAVLLETYEANNFRATVNGEPVSIFRMNQAFKGVAISGPGEYRIKFTYRPAMLLPGLILTGIGVLLGVGFLSFALRSSRMFTPEAPKT